MRTDWLRNKKWIVTKSKVSQTFWKLSYKSNLKCFRSQSCCSRTNSSPEGLFLRASGGQKTSFGLKVTTFRDTNQINAWYPNHIKSGSMDSEVRRRIKWRVLRFRPSSPVPADPAELHQPQGRGVAPAVVQGGALKVRREVQEGLTSLDLKRAGPEACLSLTYGHRVPHAKDLFKRSAAPV